MMRPRIHSVVSGLAFLAGVATCLVACGGTGGGFGHGQISNVNYKFNVTTINCGVPLIITKNTGTFPADETVTFQSLSGTVTPTVVFSTDMTMLTCTLPTSASSGQFNVDLSDAGKIGTMAYTACGA